MMFHKRRRSSVTNFKLVAISRAHWWQRWVMGFVLVILLLLLGAVGGYWLAYQQGAVSWIMTTNDTQETPLAPQQAKLQSLKQKLKVYETNHTINSRATTKIQQQIIDLEAQLAELQQAVEFYKNIMDPADQPAGLHIEHVTITPKDATHYQYSLILTQITNDKWRPTLKGQIQWQLDGLQDGKPTSLSQHVFLAQEDNLAFSFQYFQNLSGTFQLPDHFIPQQLIITANSTSHPKQHLQQHFNWASIQPSEDQHGLTQ